MKKPIASPTSEKLRFVRNRRDILAACTTPTSAAEAIRKIADEMVKRGLYRSTTAKVDRCHTVFKMTAYLSVWTPAFATEVAKQLHSK